MKEEMLDGDPIPKDPRKPPLATGECEFGYAMGEDGWCYLVEIPPIDPEEEEGGEGA